MTVSDSTTPPKSSWNLQKVLRRLVKTVADLRLAIILLLMIAVFSISGTVIEQGQSPAFYQANYPEHPALFGFLTWKVLLFLGLNHVYTTWWFLAILVAFGSSLTACTFTRQFPALKVARNWKFYHQSRQFQKLALSAELDQGSPSVLLPFLEKRGYKVFQENEAVYARKGLMGKIGPIIVHGAILIILAGAIWGALTGFLAQEMIPSGNSFKVTNIVEAGILSNSQVPTDWGVKVNRFWIDYTPSGDIDQFYSDLSVIDEQGQELKHEQIHVNQPLRYKGVTFYQADWGIAGVKVQVNKSPIFGLPMRLLDTQGGGRIWGTWIPTKPDLSEGVSLLTKDLQGTLFVYDIDGKLLSAVREGSAVDVNGVTVKVLELVGSTGLQIKADPGIPIVYTGFGLLMLGVIMSYVSHSQIWALQEGDRFYIGGKTNRAQVAFERELIDLIAQLKSTPK